MLLKSKLYARITGRLLLLLFLILSLPGRGQSFTLSVKRETLGKVFLQIEQQSEFRFIYTEELLAQSGPVSFTVRNASLDSVLRLCFLNQPLTYTTEGKHIIVRKLIEKPAAITRELRGRVVNEKGEAMAGVTIRIKNSDLATGSNTRGEFFFPEAPKSVTLIISGAEMEQQEIEAGLQPFVLITTITKLGLLDETMVIAYGKTTKRVSTGSVGRVSKDEISKQPVSNPMLALSGRISGLQITQTSGAPGSQVLVQLRGRNSLANGNDPLFIIDGIPFPSVTLNNSTGGAATYSSPFDNINPADIESIEVLKDADATAIYGSRGANGVILITTKKPVQGKTTLSFRAYAGAGTITRRMDLLSTPDYIAMRQEAFANDGVTPTNANAPDLKLWDSTRYTDWQKELIGKTVSQQDVNIGLSGGNESTQFLLGAGYHKETTVFPGNFSSEKIGGSLSLNHQSNDRRFMVSFSGSYLVNSNTLPKEDISRRITLAPNAPALYLPSGALNWENSTWINPLSILERSFTNHTEVFSSHLTLSYKVFTGLQLKISSGFTHQYLREHGITPQRSFNPATVSVSSATFGHTDLQTLITEPQISYQYQRKLHTIEAVAGITIQQTDQQNLQQTGTGYSSDGLLYSIQAAATVTTSVEADTRYRYTGQFGRIGYHYDKKYLATITIRRDGSSRYGSANRFANFYSAGIGWVFSRETWLQQQDILTFGKLRLSAGRSGNDQIGDYRYLDLYAPYPNAYQSVTPFYPTQLYNPRYSWEQVNKKELGIDLGFFKDRLQVTANYYHNITSNQLIQYPLPATTGFLGILKNLPATIRNTGVELELTGFLVQQPKKSWNVSFNLSIPRNCLMKFDGLASSSYASIYQIGLPLSIVKRFGFKEVAAATGAYTFFDYDNNGQLASPQDEQRIINGAQRYFGGMQQSVKLGKISFSFLLQFVRQPYVQNYLIRFSRPGSLGNQPSDVLNRWRKPGDITDIQRFSVSNAAANLAYNYFQFSDAAFSDASYIRLRNLYVEYDLQSTPLKRAGVKKFVVFLQGQNLLTLTSYKGLDPETQTFLPPVKMITAGVQLNF